MHVLLILIRILMFYVTLLSIQTQTRKNTQCTYACLAGSKLIGAYSQVFRELQLQCLYTGVSAINFNGTIPKHSYRCGSLTELV